MRIAHYGIRLWDPGGVASYVKRIAGLQKADGHELLFFDDREAGPDCAPELRPTPVVDDADLFRRAEQAGVDVLHLHSGVNCLPPPGLPVLRTIHTNEPYCPSGMQYRLRQELPCHRTYSLMGCAAGHVLDHCGSLRPHMLKLAFTRIRDNRRVLPHMPMLAVSEFVRQRLLTAGYPDDMIAVLPLTAPDHPDAAPPPDEQAPHFLCMGRLVPEKGLTWLLRAWARLPVPARLDVAGSGHFQGPLEALARELGVADRVQFHGWMTPAGLAPLVARARAVVVPSLWQEPGGTVTFEAMSQGRAAIVSRVGGAAEPIDDGVQGLLVQPGDVEAMAAAIARLAGDHALAAAMGQRGQAKARARYAIGPHLQALYGYYQKVQAAPGAAIRPAQA